LKALEEKIDLKGKGPPSEREEQPGLLPWIEESGSEVIIAIGRLISFAVWPKI
jgi:hypothetical protein